MFKTSLKIPLLSSLFLILGGCGNGDEGIELKQYDQVHTAFYQAEYHSNVSGKTLTNAFSATIHGLMDKRPAGRYEVWRDGKSFGEQKIEISRYEARVLLKALEDAKLRKCSDVEHIPSPDFADRQLSLHAGSNVVVSGRQLNGRIPKPFLAKVLKQRGAICGDMIAAEQAFRALSPEIDAQFKTVLSTK